VCLCVCQLLFANTTIDCYGRRVCASQTTGYMRDGESDKSNGRDKYTEKYLEHELKAQREGVLLVAKF